MSCGCRWPEALHLSGGKECPEGWEIPSGSAVYSCGISTVYPDAKRVPVRKPTCDTCSHYNAMPPAWGKVGYDGECARGVRIGEPGGDGFVPADFACCWYDRK